MQYDRCTIFTIYIYIYTYTYIYIYVILYILLLIKWVKQLKTTFLDVSTYCVTKYLYTAHLVNLASFTDYLYNEHEVIFIAFNIFSN